MQSTTENADCYIECESAFTVLPRSSHRMKMAIIRMGWGNLYDHVHCLGIRCTNLYAMYQSLWTSKWSSSDASVNDNPEKTVRSHALHWHAYFLVAKSVRFGAQ